MRPEDMVGQTLGHYRIVRQVGYGGMSTVFLAEDLNLGREVAMKVFWPRPGETKDFLRRFAREARVLAQLDHPNILPVYDYGEQDGQAYLIMPYMAGGSLKDVLKVHHVLPPAEAIRLMTEALNALQYAHERGLIHRDIKPANMLFKADGKLVLCDFGLVKVISADGEGRSPLDTSGETGQVITGTPEYMSPEQIRGQALPSSDIYSVGIVLYEMLTGIRPFTSNNVMSVLMKHLNEQPRPLREINPGISPQLEYVVLRALERDPARRYQRPSDFLQALKQAEMPGSLPAAPADWSTKTTKNTYGSAQGVYNTVDEANMSTLSSDPQVLPQAMPRPISQPGVPFQSAQESIPATVTPPGRYPQLTPQPISHPGLVQGAPAQPPAKRARRLPLAILAVLLALLAGLALTLVTTPLGHNLFAGQTPGTGGVTPSTKKGITPVVTTNAKGGGGTPSTNAQGMPPAQTSCPTSGTARASWCWETTLTLSISSMKARSMRLPLAH